MRRLATLALVTAVALGAAACGSSSDGSTTDTSSGARPDATAGTRSDATELMVADSSLGSIVVDGEGRTLYAFTEDDGTTSACTGGCATAWPALVAPVTASSEVTGTVGQATQADGSDQVTLNGHLLYYYAADAAPGATSGQGVGGTWFVVDPAGELVRTPAASGGGY